MGKFTLCVVVFVLCFASSLKGQTTNASLTGQITDASGAVLVSATVSIANVDTNVSHEGKTNESGSYYFSDLPAGSYRMEVRKPGFETIIKSGIVLHVQDAVEINFEMAV